MNEYNFLLIIRFIRPEYEEEWVEHYEKDLKFANKDKLAWEVLFKVPERSQIPFEYHDLSSPHGKFVTYFNIGAWHTLADFNDEVSQYMKREYFEFKDRLRIPLEPQAVRLGFFDLQMTPTCE